MFRGTLILNSFSFQSTGFSVTISDLNFLSTYDTLRNLNASFVCLVIRNVRPMYNICTKIYFSFCFKIFKLLMTIDF